MRSPFFFMVLSFFTASTSLLRAEEVITLAVGEKSEAALQVGEKNHLKFINTPTIEAVDGALKLRFDEKANYLSFAGFQGAFRAEAAEPKNLPLNKYLYDMIFDIDRISIVDKIPGGYKIRLSGKATSNGDTTMVRAFGDIIVSKDGKHLELSVEQTQKTDIGFTGSYCLGEARKCNTTIKLKLSFKIPSPSIKAVFLAPPSQPAAAPNRHSL